MKETNISAPDANITITDNTVEHIIYNTRTEINFWNCMRKWRNCSCHITVNILS